MQNIYETLRSNTFFRKFEIEELLFVEYTCPIEDESLGIWTQSDYLIHVLSGEKTWRTPQGNWTVSAGETLYIKKGATIVNQSFDGEFCMLGFFVSDGFIQQVLKEVSGNIAIHLLDTDAQAPAIAIYNEPVLSGYFQSMLAYFGAQTEPTDSLLELKLKELIIHILTSPHNPVLSAYFQSLLGSEKPAIRQTMEANFAYDLSLEEFARLCHRSLSSFKRDFRKHFNVSPGKWLIDKRLDYSALLLKNSDLNITQIVFESGFKDVSHFSRAFKDKYSVSPTDFRK